ncbi:MAG: serine/threonine-protein kinase [Polyangiaceae bacterium]
MIRLARGDENLQGLIGQEILSELDPNVRFRPEQTLGRGGGAIAFLSRRISPEGTLPVVLKILRPAFVRRLGPAARLLIQKEAVALGRLNERTPPTPYVIRLIDTGKATLEEQGLRTDVPWVAIEYVHGGSLGTTLAQRVRRSLRDTGFAFDPQRAANAIDCIANGLAAIHDVNVIHRDLTPNNVLCTGRGPEETMKIADFGVARPIGLKETLSGALVGTPGFAAPELADGVDANIGPHTDVFSLASMIFFILTGEALFNSAAEVKRAMSSAERRSLLDMPSLSPELRRREAACKAIDGVLSWASAGAPENRLSEALAVSSMVLPHLARVAHRQPARVYVPTTITNEPGLSNPAEWSWSVLHFSASELVIRSVAWDGQGRAIAATAAGLSFWGGNSWRVATTDGLMSAGGVRYVQRVGAGRWILGGSDASLAIYSSGGVVDLVEGPRYARSVEAFGGDLEDVSVLATADERGVVALNTYATKRWLKPLGMPHVASVSAVTRFDESRWLVVGRRAQGGAYAALYSALDWEIEEIPTPPEARAFLSAVARPRKAIGYAVGTQGAVLCRDGDSLTFERVPTEPFLSTVALDPHGRPWAGSAGKVFMRSDADGWIPAFSSEAIESPFVSLFLDVGLCIGMTADGAVVEGRATRAAGTMSEIQVPA